MSGIDTTTAGMDVVPLMGRFNTPRPWQRGARAWRGPQINPDKLLGIPQLRTAHFQKIGQMEMERSTWWKTWLDVATYLLPNRGRFTPSDTNKGVPRNQRIKNNHGSAVLRTTGAGMYTGMCSGARPWFEYHAEEDVDGDSEVRGYLEHSTTTMRNLFLRSNFYNVVPTIFTDVSGFGTAATAMVEDPHDVFRFYSFPVGSFSLASNERGVVDEFVRKAWFTPRQLVERFGKANVSKRVQGLLEQGTQVTTSIEAWWYCGPNPNWDPGRLASEFKRYISAWWEIGSSGDDCLSLKGFDTFPILATRWEVTGEDVYGHGPGEMMLPDVKELQDWVGRNARAAEKVIDPPVQAPPSMVAKGVSLMAGDVNVQAQRGDAITAVHEVKYDFATIRATVQDLKEAISRAGFEDLFLMISQDDREQPATAREIAERHEEKLQALGPVYNQLNSDFFSVVCDNAFQMALAAGKLPTPPKKLHGRKVKVEFTSILAQAMKLTEVSGIQQFFGLINPQIELQQAEQNITIPDKIDYDAVVDALADRLSLPANLIIPTDRAKKARAARQAAQAKQQQLEQANTAADTAQKLSSTDTGGKNALTDVLGGGVPGQATAPGAAA